MNTLPPKARSVIFGFLWLAVGCRPPEKADVIGLYKRSDENITAILSIKPDNKFELVVHYSEGRSLTIQDSWSLVERVVRFEKFYLTYDFEKNAIIDPPKLVYMADLSWEGGKLFLNELDQHPFERQTSTNKP